MGFLKHVEETLDLHGARAHKVVEIASYINNSKRYSEEGRT